MVELPTYERIVVGVDFSEESEHALRHAIAIARRTGAEVVIAHAETLHDLTEAADENVAAGFAEIAHEINTEAQSALAKLRERFEGQGVELSHILVDGFADSALAAAVEDLDAQLLVVGTHGRTGLRRLLLGSVSEKVVRTVHRDVLVARQARLVRGYERILVPVDFSSHSDPALIRALSLAIVGTSIDLYHVWQFPTPVYAPTTTKDARFKSLATAVEKEARAQAEALIARHRFPGVDVNIEIELGSPSASISERATGYDLVVIGSAGRRGIRRWLLGSVAEATVRHAPASVLVVHHDD
jgi:nucleotide-binding universal stress UspA family protein